MPTHTGARVRIARRIRRKRWAGAPWLGPSSAASLVAERARASGRPRAGASVEAWRKEAGKGQQIRLPSETVLNFTLRAPLTVTLAEQGPDSSRRKLDAPQ